MDDKKLEQLLQFNREQERKRLFQEVAIAYAGNIMHSYDLVNHRNQENFINTVTECANTILQASEDFAKEQE